ncbi:uncharacterized protein LOC110774211 [Prunus avium]|uniref:Uncharacterized protein LOC110774211 n=1 Tax=Prunus avium TaxID=42229 RepID=A0A6P5U529_PRUAV|nr:uncharacterized protein LOC110774211 [Prunus avium]
MITESTQTPEPSPTVTPSNSVISTDTSNLLITINAAAQLPVKLTPLNYLSWCTQFNALLLGYDLLGYLDGTHPCPPKPATVSPTSPHTLWVRQDQLLLHAILASVSEQVISLIATTTTSKVAWEKLNQLYASKARSRVMGLKERLSLMHRDSKPISEYLQCVKAIADELALIDLPLSNDDLVIHILNGVAPEFKEISAPVCARDSSISFETLYDKLVEYEATLK